MSDKKYPIARNHPTLHAAPTFRPIQKGRRKTGLINDYKTESGNLRIEMMYELDIADQDLMLTIFAIARAQSRGKIINADDSESELLTGLEVNLKDADDLKVNEKPSLQISVSRYELLSELGKGDGKSAYEWLKQSLNRLAKVGFFYDGKKWSGSFNMINWKADNETGQIKIIINPINSQSIALDNEGYINIHREERHSLKSDDSKALHSALCGLVSPGTKRSLKVDKLADRVYASYEDKKIKPIDENLVKENNLIRYRRKNIKDAANDVGLLKGWDIIVNGRGEDSMITVKRKKYSK